VNVAKKQITFTKSDYEWKSINDDPYTLYDDGEHLQCSALNIRVIFIKLVILSVLVF